MTIKQAGLGLVEALTDVALALAQRHDLVSDRGVIICWGCRDADALLPSLHCPRCLHAHRRKHGIEAGTVNVAQAIATIEEPGTYPRRTADEIKAALAAGGERT